MPKLTPVEPERLIRLFERLGYRRAGIRGSHLRMTRPGAARPLAIPLYREVPLFIVLNNPRTAGLSREDYFRLLEDA
jgi:predicted RNA binding protein YcfA (HicA-like mRNA interferase family)